MKLKEIKQKFKGYRIVERGYRNSAPYAFMNGVTSDTDIKGYEVKEEPVTLIDITSAVMGGGKKKDKSYKGTVTVWYKE